MTARQELLNVLVIGDVCIDTYHICYKQARDNPEAPGQPIYTNFTYSEKKGMAGFVAQCLENLNFNVTTLYPSGPAITKNRYFDQNGTLLLRVDSEKEDETPYAPITINNLPNIDEYSAIVIADYCKGSITETFVRDLSELAGCPIFLDTKKKNLSFARKSNIITKINLQEYLAASDIPLDPVITLGAKGAKWMGNTYPAYYYNKTQDVCGAGDAFMAGFVYGYLQGTHPSVIYGVVNAGISVAHVGTYSPSLTELQEGIYEYYKKNGY